jgi:hypothetical protein
LTEDEYTGDAREQVELSPQVPAAVRELFLGWSILGRRTFHGSSQVTASIAKAVVPFL